MKLLINNIPVPYMGGCTVERNLPMFSDGGLENAFTYSFKVPIYPVTQKLFGNAERVTTATPTEQYDLKMMHDNGAELEGYCRLIGADDEFYHLNATDTSTSIYGVLKDLKMSDLVLDKYTFNSYQEFVDWIKNGSTAKYEDWNVCFPLLHIPDFFKDADKDTYPDEIEAWENFPVINHWHGLKNSENVAMGNTLFFPSIRLAHIGEAIKTKLNATSFNLGFDDVFFTPKTFLDKTADELLSTQKAYQEEGGQIKLDLNDFLPDMSVFDFLTKIFQRNFQYVTVRNFTQISIATKAGAPDGTLAGSDIAKYALSAKPDFEKGMEGWTYNYFGDVRKSGKGEFKVEITDDPINQVIYTKDTTAIKIGSIDISFGDDSVFETHGYLVTANEHGDASIRNSIGCMSLYLYPLDWFWNTIPQYLDWKVKAKRVLKLKCIPDKYLIASVDRRAILYKNATFLPKSARWELLEERVGVVSMDIVEG